MRVQFWVFYRSLGRIGLPVGLADWFCVVVTTTFCCPLLGVNQGIGREGGGVRIMKTFATNCAAPPTSLCEIDSQALTISFTRFIYRNYE